MQVPEIDLNTLLELYRRGCYPMSESEHDTKVFVVEPNERGIFPLDRLHVPRRIQRKILSQTFNITVDRAFAHVIDECAAKRYHGRTETWINSSIKQAFNKLHQIGKAHSIECWNGDKLAGGLYGLHMGSAFFGESMFTAEGETDASKVALVHLAARLWHGKFKILDSQMVSEHWKNFGQETITQEQFLIELNSALNEDANFFPDHDEMQMVKNYLELIR